jgi:hypothetical protein
MPLWVPLLVLVLGPIVVYGAGELADLHPFATSSFAIVVAGSATTVLCGRAVAAWGPQPAVHLPAWAEWTVLGAPMTTAALSSLWSRRHAARLDTVARTPVGRCERCHAELYADRTGYRYVSEHGDYLCPEPWRPARDRRHRVVLTAWKPC